MMICLLALLILSTQVLAQPVEGPWDVIEATGDEHYQSPHVLLAGDSSATVFIGIQSTDSARLESVDFSLITHQTVGELQLWASDTGAVDVAIRQSGRDPSGKRGVALTWGRVQQVLVECEDGVRDQIRYECYMCPLLHPSIVAIGESLWGVNWIWYHFDPRWSNYRLTTSVYEDTVLQAGPWMITDVLSGPTAADLIEVSPDTLLVLARGYNGALGPQSRLILYSTVDSLPIHQVDFQCAAYPLLAGMTRSRVILVLSSRIPGGGAYQAIQIDTAGNCQGYDTLDYPQLDAVTWHSSYGFAGLIRGDNQIWLVRIDTLGAEVHPMGLLQTVGPGRQLTDMHLSISDAGRVIVVWGEANSGQTEAWLIRIAAVDWDAPLGSGESAFIPQPSSFSLSAYPNPFNGELQIRYELPRTGQIEVAVLNVLGQKVAVLEKGMQSAGTHRTNWTAETGSGIYFVRLDTEDAVRTEKVLLVR